MVLPDVFIDHDTPTAMYAQAGLDAKGIVAKVFEALGPEPAGRGAAAKQRDRRRRAPLARRARCMTAQHASRAASTSFACSRAQIIGFDPMRSAGGSASTSAPRPEVTASVVCARGAALYASMSDRSAAPSLRAEPAVLSIEGPIFARSTRHGCRGARLRHRRCQLHLAQAVLPAALDLAARTGATGRADQAAIRGGPRARQEGHRARSRRACGGLDDIAAFVAALGWHVERLTSPPRSRAATATASSSWRRGAAEARGLSLATTPLWCRAMTLPRTMPGRIRAAARADGRRDEIAETVKLAGRWR